MQSRFVIVDEDGRRDVHRVHEAKALFDAALAQRLFHLRRDVHKTPAGREVHREVGSVGVHAWKGEYRTV